MALSAVSRGVFTVGLVVGKAALPIAVDLITFMAIHSLVEKKISPSVKWAISSFPACTAVYLTSGVPKWDASSVITCSLYVFYKSLPFIANRITAQRKEAAAKRSLDSLANQYHTLMERVTFTTSYQASEYASFEEFSREVAKVGLNVQLAVRNMWRDPETVRLADALMREAAHAMNSLYSDLSEEVSDEPAHLQLKKMAELLTRRQGPNDYYSRFCSQGTVTLLDIYRAVRGLSFSVRCEGGTPPRTFSYSIIDNCNKANQRQLDEDVDPFFTSGTQQFAWRRIYHDTLGRFAPVISQLDFSREDPRAFREWSFHDDFPQVAKNDAPGVAFKLHPCEKPA